ncbi:hypothetical protein [Streptomyces sp. NPDC004533]|uniref:hypothetical protein n=1 Tax=Streptomyces sp. NPDC004533 TaxID=3154278 RepID=UPI0033A0DCA3
MAEQGTRLLRPTPEVTTHPSESMNNADFVMVGLFVIVWAGALGYWHIAKVEHRWDHAGSPTETN